MTRFKEARENAGFTQKEAAINLDVSVQAVSYWETGNRTPSIEKIVQMCDLYNVTADYLLGRTPMTVTLVQGDPPPKGEDEYELVLDPNDLPQSPDDLDALIRAAVNEAVTEELKKRGL